MDGLPVTLVIGIIPKTTTKIVDCIPICPIVVLVGFGQKIVNPKKIRIMKTSLKTIAVAVVGSFSLLGSVSAAQPPILSLTVSDLSSAPIGSSYFTSSGVPGAVFATFETGSQGYNLDSISALLNPIVGGGNYTLALYDSGLTFLANIDTVNSASVTFGVPTVFEASNSLSAPIFLNPNTTYKIGIGTDGHSGGWTYTDAGGFDQSAGAYGTLIDSGLVDSAGNLQSSYTPLFSVSAVPEPSTLALVGIGAASLLAFRRKQA